MSDESKHKFALYNSVLQGEESETSSDDEETAYYKMEIEKLKQKLEDLQNEVKIFLKLKEIAERDNEELKLKIVQKDCKFKHLE